MKEYRILRDRSAYPDGVEKTLNQMSQEGCEVVGYSLASTDIKGASSAR